MEVRRCAANSIVLWVPYDKQGRAVVDQDGIVQCHEMTYEKIESIPPSPHQREVGRLYECGRCHLFFCRSHCPNFDSNGMCITCFNQVQVKR